MSTIKVGDIVCARSGYGRGNVDFYQIVHCGRVFVTLRAIQSQQTEGDGWSGKLAPIRDAFIASAPLLHRRIHQADGRPAFLITRHAAAYPWDGTPQDFADPA
jgi:hypothetical protein